MFLDCQAHAGLVGSFRVIWSPSARRDIMDLAELFPPHWSAHVCSSATIHHELTEATYRHFNSEHEMEIITSLLLGVEF